MPRNIAKAFAVFYEGVVTLTGEGEATDMLKKRILVHLNEQALHGAMLGWAGRLAQVLQHNLKRTTRQHQKPRHSACLKTPKAHKGCSCTIRKFVAVYVSSCSPSNLSLIHI